VQTRAWAKKD
jgi:hypothetical protein